MLELLERLGLEARFEPERPGEVKRSVLDPRAAREALGWRAEVSLSEGLERTMRA